MVHAVKTYATPFRASEVDNGLGKINASLEFLRGGVGHSDLITHHLQFGLRSTHAGTSAADHTT